MRDFKRITDVVKQRRQTPMLEKVACGFFAVRKAVFAVVSRSKYRVVFVDDEPDQKHINAVRIVVSVFHQQRTCVGFMFAEKFQQQPCGIIARAKRLEYLAIAIVNIERVLLGT